jgi:hypothetical protein
MVILVSRGRGEARESRVCCGTETPLSLLTFSLDKERAANLGVLAKPMRAALKTHKPIFWKKSAYGHSNENSNLSKWEGQAMASESQWGSSGNALDSMLFSSRNATNPSSASKTAEEDEKSALNQSVCWEETQYEEREKTWDRVGDTDFEVTSKKVRRRK